MAQGGDRNTEFFYQIANAHKRYNHIDQLEIHGETISEPKRIKEEIISFYKNCKQKLKIGDPLKTSAIIQPSQKLKRRLCKKF